MNRLPILAVTLGDPAGIGPEVVSKALKDNSIYKLCRPLLVGDTQSLSILKSSNRVKIRPILNPAQAKYKAGTLDILHIPFEEFHQIRVGRPTVASGVLSYLSVIKSVELALAKLVDGIVHAPISKLAWKEAGVVYPGHTELISKLCRSKKSAMAIASGPLRTVLVTRHIPLSQVSSLLKKNEIIDCIQLAEQWMKSLKLKNPKIGVCSLNPHGGENGLIGKDELRVIQPAVVQAQRKTSARILGPLPADTAFKNHVSGHLDCLVTMYHDQSLIATKLYDSTRVVNLTLGLPFARTSPGHGTAFDIAGKNSADARPMKEAILKCAEQLK